MTVHADPTQLLRAMFEAAVARAMPEQCVPPFLPQPPTGRTIVVQPGNSLWKMARESYGQGVRYTVIYEANKDQIANPDLIYPGQVFSVPTGD